MSNRDLVRLVGTVLLGGVIMLVTLPACGGATAEVTTPIPTAPQTTPIATTTATATASLTSVTVTPTASVAPVPLTPTVAPATTPSSTGPSDSELLAQGKLIFEKTAGRIGCAYCHGLDGRGKGPAGIQAADIRGKDEGYIRRAIQSGVPSMSFLKLSDDEITAVAVYLQYLATQP